MDAKYYGNPFDEDKSAPGMPFEDEMFSSGGPEEDEDNVFGVVKELMPLPDKQGDKAIGQVMEDFAQGRQ